MADNLDIIIHHWDIQNFVREVRANEYFEHFYDARNDRTKPHRVR